MTAAQLRRLAALEHASQPAAPDGALPHIVEPDQLDSAEASEMRHRGYQVLTLEQCVLEAV